MTHTNWPCPHKLINDWADREKDKEKWFGSVYEFVSGQDWRLRATLTPTTWATKFLMNLYL